MSSHEIQGELWGRAPLDWADLQEGFSVPLWQSMLTACGVSTGTRLLDAGCGAGGACALARRHGAIVTVSTPRKDSWTWRGNGCPMGASGWEIWKLSRSPMQASMRSSPRRLSTRGSPIAESRWVRSIGRGQRGPEFCVSVQAVVAAAVVDERFVEVGDLDVIDGGDHHP